MSAEGVLKLAPHVTGGTASAIIYAFTGSFMLSWVDCVAFIFYVPSGLLYVE